jgi:GNAT superfamily N-acetyltransferase
MIHYQTYTAAEGEKIVDLWNRSFNGDFPLDLRLWQQNVDNCKRTFADASIVAVRDGHIVGAIVGKNPNKVSVIFVAPECRRLGIATELLARAEVAFTGELETSITVGQDDRHFFPGIPENAVEAQSFFTARGYTGGDGWMNDMFRSLADWRALPARPDVAENIQARQIALVPCTAALVPSLLEHVASNFSERWLRDTRDRISAEPDPGEIIVAVEHGENVVGFAHTFSTRSIVVGSPIMWRSLIGTNYGGLGPIGVSKDHRKIGLGLELLNFSITRVAETGAEAMVIDWTGLVDFYGKVGFHVWKRYKPYGKTF